jgi:hypothetical protein
MVSLVRVKYSGCYNKPGCNLISTKLKIPKRFCTATGQMESILHSQDTYIVNLRLGDIIRPVYSIQTMRYWSGRDTQSRRQFPPRTKDPRAVLVNGHPHRHGTDKRPVENETKRNLLKGID